METRARGRNEARHQGRKASVTSERIRTNQYIGFCRFTSNCSWFTALTVTRCTHTLNRAFPHFLIDQVEQVPRLTASVSNDAVLEIRPSSMTLDGCD